MGLVVERALTEENLAPTCQISETTGKIFILTFWCKPFISLFHFHFHYFLFHFLFRNFLFCLHSNFFFFLRRKRRYQNTVVFTILYLGRTQSDFGTSVGIVFLLTGWNIKEAPFLAFFLVFHQYPDSITNTLLKFNTNTLNSYRFWNLITNTLPEIPAATLIAIFVWTFIVILISDNTDLLYR